MESETLFGEQIWLITRDGQRDFVWEVDLADCKDGERYFVCGADLADCMDGERDFVCGADLADCKGWREILCLGSRFS